MNNEEILIKAQRAKMLIEDPLIAEAFQTLETEILRQWREAPARDAEGREKLWMMVKLCDRIKQHFESIINSGKLAGALIEEKAEEEKKRLGIKNFFKH